MSRIFEALQQSAPGPEGADARNFTSPQDLSELAAGLADRSPTALEDVPAFSIASSSESRLVAISDPLNLGAEKVRMLGAKLKYAQHRQSVKKLLITSTVRNEGKSTISANLAVTLAKQRQKTLLIDGDLHQPSLGGIFGTGLRPGLGDWWRQQKEIQSFLCRAQGLPLWLLPAGSALDQPLAMVQSPEVAELVNTLSGWFDWVIIDSPPITALADAGAWATVADSILLVARRGVTPKSLFQKAAASLDKAKLLGAVLNDADEGDRRYYAAYYKDQGQSGGRAAPRESGLYSLK